MTTDTNRVPYVKSECRLVNGREVRREEILFAFVEHLLEVVNALPSR
jgi:hypothetical protein